MVGYPSFSRSAGNSGSLGRLLLRRRNMVGVAGKSEWDAGRTRWLGNKASKMRNEGPFVEPNNDSED